MKERQQEESLLKKMLLFFPTAVDHDKQNHNQLNDFYDVGGEHVTADGLTSH